jgi:hypothetical protein
MTLMELYRKGFMGSINYTQKRHQWLDPLTMDEILADIEQRQSDNPKTN